MSDLSVLCFNCLGSPVSLNRKQRLPVIAQEIENLNPDVAMLQEVSTPRSSLLLDTKLKKYGWNSFFTKGWLFRLGGLTIYSKKYDLKDLHFHPFDNQGPIASWSLADRLVLKGFQTAVLSLPKKEILLINTHITCNYSKDKKKNGFQKQQLDQLMRFIKSQPYQEIILAGDLSNQPVSSNMEAFVSSTHLKDTLDEKRVTVDPITFKGNWLLNMFGSKQPTRVDYVMVSPTINIKKSDVVLTNQYLIGKKSVYLSDHFGVFARLGVRA